MKNNDDLEAILINKTSMDDLIKLKIEKEFQKEFESAKKTKTTKIISDIKDAPQNKIFSKQAVYRLFNRKSKSETLINGIQAEAMLGLQDNIRIKLQNGEISSFTTDDAYIKFEKLCLNS